MKKWHVLYKAIFLALMLLLLYISATQPDEYLKLWFVALWSAVAVVTIARLEVKDWSSGTNELRLSPVVQLLLALVLVLGAAVSTEWKNLGIRTLTPWAYALFALPVYRQGFAWGWSQLQSKGTN
jgi:phosphatidylserine synthase